MKKEDTETMEREVIEVETVHPGHGLQSEEHHSMSTKKEESTFLIATQKKSQENPEIFPLKPLWDRNNLEEV